MSTSPETGGRNSSGKAPEVFDFSKRACLLRHYLKEKRTFADMNFGFTRKSEVKGNSGEPSRQAATILKLPPIMENPAEVAARNTAASKAVKSLDFRFNFPSSSSAKDAAAKEKADTDARKSAGMESGTAQMTIIYGGKVMVFDDFPADKTKEIVALAAKGSSSTCVSNPPKSGKALLEEQFCGKPLPTGSDLPIARRGSLHRFLEKRKDRVGKTPNEVNLVSEAAPKPEGSTPYMEGQSSDDLKQLELKL